MSFRHDNRRPRRHGARRREEHRREREGNNGGAQEMTQERRDQMITAIMRNIASAGRGAHKPTRQGIVNLIAKWMEVRAKSFDEAIQTLRYDSRTFARNVIQFAEKHGVDLYASDLTIQPNGGSTGMARTRKQEEQRRAREEREATAGKGGSKGASKGAQGAKTGAGQAAGGKGGAEGAGASKSPSAGKRAPAQRTPRQPDLPDPDGKGFKQERIPSIDAATESYLTFRDEHATVTKNLSDAKTHLMAEMKKHNRTRYNFEGQVVEYIHEESENVKVHKIAKQKSGDDEPAAV